MEFHLYDVDSSIKYGKVLEILEIEDEHYSNYFVEDDGKRKKNWTTYTKWLEKCISFCEILKSLFDATLKFRATLRVCQIVLLESTFSIKNAFEEKSSLEK